MCCCDNPIINGQMGYKWQPNDAPMVRPVDPPSTEEGDVILYDGPGRCGGIDSHSHHYRLVKRHGCAYLLVKNGGGEKCISMSLYGKQLDMISALDGNSLYWLLNAIYHAQFHAAQNSREAERATWQRAAAEKRIKTRKMPSRGTVKVWIEQEN